LPPAPRRLADHARRLCPHRRRRRRRGHRHAAGGAAADVWIVSDKPVERRRCCRPKESFTRNMPGSLPSRAADNLFWLGRYIERAEGALRILRAWHARFAEAADPSQPLLADVSEYLAAVDIDTEDAVPESLLRNIDSAVYSASNIRDRFSPDGWLALNDLAKTARRFQSTISGRRRRQPCDDDPAAQACGLCRSGARKHVPLHRLALPVARPLYRARPAHDPPARPHVRPDAPDGALDMLLEIGDSVMTHRRRYNVNTARLTVTDLLALDPLNPRSILFQMNEIQTRGRATAERLVNGQMSPFYREAMRLHSGLAVMTPEAMNDEVYHRSNASWSICPISSRRPISGNAMLYDLSLHMGYIYEFAGFRRRHIMRVLPLSLPDRQRLVAGSIKVSPTPDEQSNFVDFFEHPGDLLHVSASRMKSSTSACRPACRWIAIRSPPISRPCSRMPDEIAGVWSLKPESPHHFLGSQPAPPETRRSPTMPETCAQPS
jgi:uncharacterized alpha-E superfamily protein